MVVQLAICPCCTGNVALVVVILPIEYLKVSIVAFSFLIEHISIILSLCMLTKRSQNVHE